MRAILLARRIPGGAAEDVESGAFQVIEEHRPMGTFIELVASDGHTLSAYRAEPAGKPRGSYDAPSAKLARERTLAFFREHLG